MTDRKPTIGAAKLGMLLESKLNLNLMQNLESAAKPSQRKATKAENDARSTSRRNLKRGASQRSNTSGESPSKYSDDYSRMGEGMPPNEKMLKYIKRLASAAMPTVYSHKYIREQTKKAMRALEAMKNAEDEIIDDPNAVTGFNATL